MSEFQTRQIPDSVLTYVPEDFPKLSEPDSGAVLSGGVWSFEGEQVSNSTAVALDKLRFAMDLFALKCGYYLLEMNVQNVVGSSCLQKSTRKGYLCKTLLEVKNIVTVWGWQIDPAAVQSEEDVYKEFWKALFFEFRLEATTSDVNFRVRLARKKKMAEDWNE